MHLGHGFTVLEFKLYNVTRVSLILLRLPGDIARARFGPNAFEEKP